MTIQLPISSPLFSINHPQCPTSSLSHGIITICISRRVSRRATTPAEEALTGDVRAKRQARLETKVAPQVLKNAHAIAVQATEQVKEQGNGNTERLLLLSVASRNGTSSNPESSETSAPEPSHAAPAGASGMKAAPPRRRRSSENVCVQPGFAVVGLVGTFGERVLLLPTEEGRRRLAVEAAASATAAAAATAASDDGGGSVAAVAAAADAAAASDGSEGSAACEGEGKGEGLCRALLCSVSYPVRWHDHCTV